MSTGFSSPFVPKNSFQITRLRLVIWKEFSGTHGEENPVLTFPPHSNLSLLKITNDLAVEQFSLYMKSAIQSGGKIIVHAL